MRAVTLVAALLSLVAVASCVSEKMEVSLLSLPPSLRVLTAWPLPPHGCQAAPQLLHKASCTQAGATTSPDQDPESTFTVFPQQQMPAKMAWPELVRSLACSFWGGPTAAACTATPANSRRRRLPAASNSGCVALHQRQADPGRSVEEPQTVQPPAWCLCLQWLIQPARDYGNSYYDTQVPNLQPVPPAPPAAGRPVR